MANFIGLVYATLKKEGIDTSGMDTDEAVAKYNELQKKSGGKAGEKEPTPAENKRLQEKDIEREITKENYLKDSSNAKQHTWDVEKEVATWSDKKKEAYYDMLELDLERAKHTDKPEEVWFGGTLFAHKNYMRAIDKQLNSKK